MNLVMLGLPGSGKGTQASKISSRMGIPHISTGNIFREAIKNETTLGKSVKSSLDKGELVSDDVTIEIIKERLKKEDCNHGFLLDGFPRTITQAESLDLISKIDHVVYIEINEDELIRRLSGRWICRDCDAAFHESTLNEKTCSVCSGQLYQRSDDQLDTIKHRIHINSDLTSALIDYYTDRTLKVNGNQSVEKVLDDILKVLKVNA